MSTLSFPRFIIRNNTTTRRIVYSALCLLVGILSGRVLLLDVPLKWEIAFLAALGTVTLVLVIRSPKRVILFALALTVPIYFGKAVIVHTGLVSLANGAGIGLSDILVLILLLLFLAKLAHRHVAIRFFPWTTIPALAWLVLSSVSLVAAKDNQLVVIQLINMGKLLLLCWVIASSLEDEVDVTFVIKGMLLGMFFQAVVGIYQGFTGRPLGLEFLSETAAVNTQYLGVGSVNRVQGTMGHPNSYAMYISTVIPFALALLFSSRRFSIRVLAVVLICLGSVALIYSLSRSAWINFLLSICIVLALAFRRRLIGLRAAVLIAGTISLVLSGLILFGTDVILSRFTSDDRGSAYGRIKLAQAALAMIEDHPWVGVGLNNYTLVSRQYDPNAFVKRITYVVHNAYLLIAAETGLVGLTAFLGFLAILLFQTWRVINHARNDTIWIASVGAFSALVALTIHSMTDYALLGSSMLLNQFWLLAGLAAALIHLINCEEKARHPARPVLLKHHSA